MPISKIKSNAINDDAITTAKLVDNAVTLGKTNNLFVNTEISGTEAARMPVGTTAQRSSAQAGDIRFNTTLSLMEYYDGASWSAIAPPPTVVGVSPTTFDGSSGSTFTVTGANFDANVNAKFITNGGTESSAATVTRNSANSVTITSPQIYSVADEPLDVKIINGSGLSVVLENAIDCGGLPTWTTAAGSLGNINDRYGSYSPAFTVAATDPEGGAITYSLQSGSIPAGMSLNTTNGQVTGDPTDVSASTTSNFTIRATDVGSNTADRSMSFTINRTDDGTTSARAFENPNEATGYASSGTATLYTSIYGQITPYQTLVSFADAANPKYRTTRTAVNDGTWTYGLSAHTNVGGETTLINGSANGCSEGTSSAYNWYGATAACMKRGARLCTKAEIEDGASMGSGCSHDSRSVWTSTKNGSGEYYIQEGATAANNEYRSPSDMSGTFPSSTQQVGIRCCAPTSGTNDWFA